MTETLILVLGLIIAVGVAAIIALLLRPRAPTADPAAEQRLAEMNANLQAMGQLLASAQGQLQQSVNQRLADDAGDLAVPDPVEQADPRRLRPGPA
jgi:type II secretory pathway pseudopilin PulG